MNTWQDEIILDLASFLEAAGRSELRENVAALDKVVDLLGLDVAAG